MDKTGLRGLYAVKLEFTPEGPATARTEPDPKQMSRFVWFLTQILDRQVLDKTGLNGFYDFVFVQPRTVLPSPDSSETTLFDELKDQLGLRLEPIRAPVEFLVIDHAEKPDAN